ncbi:MAG: molybdopterin-dependent oxidoreductase, partial [Eubacteriales bacterium]
MTERPWTWEEDGYTVIRGNARTGPGCHINCGVLQYVKDGKLVKVEGDPENPYNQGRLCARCLSVKDVVYHKDRLQYPMKRVGERGENKWERISWDEAYNLIEEKFNCIKEKYGPESVFFAQGTGRDIFQLSRLAYSFGSPNHGGMMFAGNSCYLPRMAALGCVIGDMVFADCSQFFPDRYENPQYKVPETIIVWGHNPFPSNADGFFGHWMIDVMKRGSKIIVVDPRLTWIAVRAVQWLQLRPGTDGALAMGM